MNSFLNKNLITHFAWYLEKEKKNDLKTLSIYRVRDIFMEKTCRKYVPKASPRRFLNFAK